MNPVSQQVISALGPVVAAFHRLGVRYYVGGSIASSIFGMPRTTMDVDVVADLRLEHVASLVDSLKGEYYASPNFLSLDGPNLSVCRELSGFSTRSIFSL
jgi:hypothetical protein